LPIIVGQQIARDHAHASREQARKHEIYFVLLPYLPASGQTTTAFNTVLTGSSFTFEKGVPGRIFTTPTG
jgi:hypothetical protein